MVAIDTVSDWALIHAALPTVCMSGTRDEVSQDEECMSGTRDEVSQDEVCMSGTRDEVSQDEEYEWYKG